MPRVCQGWVVLLVWVAVLGLAGGVTMWPVLRWGWIAGPGGGLVAGWLVRVGLCAWLIPEGLLAWLVVVVLLGFVWRTVGKMWRRVRVGGRG